MLAPDLPGHGSAPAPPGNDHGMVDAAFVATRLFAQEMLERVELVMGIGVSGWSAQLLAVAGRADRLVLVDGLGDPFLSVDELMDRRIERARITADSDDPLADAPPEPHGDRDLANRVAPDISVPVLLIGPDNQAHRQFVDIFPNAGLHILADHDPDVIAGIVAEWITTT